MHYNADVADDAYRDGKCAMHAIRSLAEMKEQEQPFFFAVGLVEASFPMGRHVAMQWGCHTLLIC
ncbi:MAG: hypothetical protein R6U85_04715 [Salinivirgaceae bacterium]